MAESLRDRVRRLVAKSAGRCDVSEHKLPDTLTLEELGLDSLDRLELAVEVELEVERVNSIPDDDVAAWVTIADVVRSAEAANV